MKDASLSKPEFLWIEEEEDSQQAELAPRATLQDEHELSQDEHEVLQDSAVIYIDEVQRRMKE